VPGERDVARADGLRRKLHGGPDRGRGVDVHLDGDGRGVGRDQGTGGTRRKGERAAHHARRRLRVRRTNASASIARPANVRDAVPSATPKLQPESLPPEFAEPPWLPPAPIEVAPPDVAAGIDPVVVTLPAVFDAAAAGVPPVVAPLLPLAAAVLTV